MSDPTLFDAEHLLVRRRCEVCGGALSVVHSHLYVVQRQTWIKIGATDSLRRRINELSRPAWRKHLLHPRLMDWNAPLTVHAMIIGGGFMEHEVHARLAEHSVIGEWFADNLTTRRWIEEVKHEAARA